MQNKLLSEPAMEIVLTPKCWQIISTLFDSEATPVQDQVHLDWMRAHVDRHPAREILFAFEGEGVYGFKGEVYPCRPGTIFMFNAYEEHDNYYPPACPRMLHLWLHFLEGDVVARFLEIEDGKIKIRQSQLIFSNDKAMNLLMESWTALVNASDLPAPFKRAKLLAVLSSVFLRIAEQGFNEVVSKPAEKLQSQIIRSIQKHLAKTAGRDVSLTEAARLAGYSKFHFLRMFKKETGQTFHEFVNLCRLKQIRSMLDHRQPKTEIAKTLGFSHPSALLRWMKSMNREV